MNKEEKSKNIFIKIWKFMNKSPILSALIISLIAILSSQIYKVYTYIYWLPYFKLFEVPPHYFENALFDKYKLLLETAPTIVTFILLFIIFDFWEKKIKFSFIKTIALELTVLIILSIVFITLVNTKIIISFIWISDILSCITLSITLLLIKNLLSEVLTNKKVKITAPLLIVFVLLFLVSSCSMVYINGYNSNVVDTICLDSRTIDEDKFVVFETSEQYYVIPCEKKEDGSIKVYRDSYGFIDKEKQLVTKNRGIKIYNEYDLSLDDAIQKFVSVEW